MEHCSVCGQPDNCGDCNHIFVDDPRLSLWYTTTTDENGTENRYQWWAEDRNHAIEQTYIAWPDETVHFAFEA